MEYREYQSRQAGRLELHRRLYDDLAVYHLQTDGKQKHIDFIDKFVGYYVFDDGSIRGYELETYNVDNINEGRSTFDLYRETGKDKYKKAIELLYSQLKTQPRTGTGNFAQENLSRSGPGLTGCIWLRFFYTRYEAEFNGGKNFSDIVNQFQNVYDNMYDKKNASLTITAGTTPSRRSCAVKRTFKELPLPFNRRMVPVWGL